MAKKVAMIVNNSCAPDTRVIKEAESLVRHGYRVRVFCKAEIGVPAFEVIQGVEYYRVKHGPADILLQKLRFWRRPKRASNYD